MFHVKRSDGIIAFQRLLAEERLRRQVEEGEERLRQAEAARRTPEAKN